VNVDEQAPCVMFRPTSEEPPNSAELDKLHEFDRQIALIETNDSGQFREEIEENIAENPMPNAAVEDAVDEGNATDAVIENTSDDENLPQPDWITRF
jgi:hypothetical protein